MSDQSDLSLPDGFDNIVRLFPLPNVVLFPGIVQALHLFEPRYRALAEDALSSDELITMASLAPDGNLVGDDERPAIAKTVCVGKILSHTVLDDGRYNLFLIGLKRAHIVHELTTSEVVYETPYRMAEVKIIDDVTAYESDFQGCRQQVVETFRELASLKTTWNTEALDQFLSDDLPLVNLVDMICYSSGATPEQQQQVLEAIDLEQRCDLVVQILRDQIESSKGAASKTQDFPPDFSLN